MSDSVRPQRQQPTRLPHPWDSPGKNTGVGCHFLQCMKVKSESEVAQSCLTLCDPMDCSPPGSSIHEIFQARVLEWNAITFSSLKLISSQITAASSFLDLATQFLKTEERRLLTQRQSFWSQLQFRRQFPDYMVPHNLPHLFPVKIYEHLLCAHHKLSLVPFLISYISCRSATQCPYSLPP